MSKKAMSIIRKFAAGKKTGPKKESRSRVLNKIVDVQWLFWYTTAYRESNQFKKRFMTIQKIVDITIIYRIVMFV
tara:strand:- start:876 stop:1100 length:225 start_codon:yes stop_codon:yes gene_type:complete